MGFGDIRVDDFNPPDLYKRVTCTRRNGPGMRGKAFLCEVPGVFAAAPAGPAN